MFRTLTLVCAVALCSASATAQPKDPQAEARALFEIGAKAYKAGNYADAIGAFEQAFQRAERSGLMFSLGQAHRMQYFAKGNPENLKSAVKYYRMYLEKDPKGSRRGEVQEALEKLVPQLEKLEETQSEPTPAVEKKKYPHLMVSSQTPGADIMIDGRSVGDYFASEVSPGKHKIEVRAPGFVTDSREVNVAQGRDLPPFSIDLQEKPAHIAVRAPAGASVSIDGRVQGTTPLPPLETKPGRHFVAVVLNGHEAFTREVDVQRGERVNVEAKLETTGQRTTSWILMGIGAGAVVTGGVFGVVALSKDHQARDLLDSFEGAGNQKPSDRDRYDQLRKDRDTYRLAAFLTGGAGLVVGATGLVLHMFDEPRVRAPELQEKPKPGAPKPGAPKMELSAAPIVAPGFTGGGVFGRF